jgi:hypothetical protein
MCFPGIALTKGIVPLIEVEIGLLDGVSEHILVDVGEEDVGEREVFEAGCCSAPGFKIFEIWAEESLSRCRTHWRLDVGLDEVELLADWAVDVGIRSWKVGLRFIIRDLEQFGFHAGRRLLSGVVEFVVGDWILAAFLCASVERSEDVASIGMRRRDVGRFVAVELGAFLRRLFFLWRWFFLRRFAFWWFAFW